MIGYYVHHQGSGHLRRATAVAAALGRPVTGLSSLERPQGWPGAWVRLPRDDDGAVPDPTAGGSLHWAPRGHRGLCSRMNEISSWIRTMSPAAIVSDVSVEVALLARLHGIPVVSVVLPGVRDDPAHLLGFGASDALVGFWPERVTGMVRGLPLELRERLRAVGGISRFEATSCASGASGRRRVTLLAGAGGSSITRPDLDAARRATPSWQWTVLHPQVGQWLDDPFPAISAADVVITHAGQNAVADVAAARRPAVVIPEGRPHLEQHATASALLEDGWPALVLDRFAAQPWDHLLAEAAALDGSRWAPWCDGRAIERFAQVLADVSLAP